MFSSVLTDEEAYKIYKKAELPVNWFFQYFKNGKIEDFLCAGSCLEEALRFCFVENGYDIEVVRVLNLDLETAVAGGVD